MVFQRFETPQLSIFTYLLADPLSNECILIDPVIIIDPVTEFIKKKGLVLKAILETHVHADFVSGSKDLKRYYQNLPEIYCSYMGGDEWYPLYADYKVVDGTELILGNYRLKALHTPGHTPEHVIWICYDDSRNKNVPWFCFTGDLIFVDGVGRPDLIDKSTVHSLSTALYKTLFERLKPFPDFMEIFPAHGVGSLCGKSMNPRQQSTLGYERTCNCAFKKLPEDQWIEELLKDMPAAPQIFQHIKKLNAKGPKFMQESNHKIQELKVENLGSTYPLAFMIDVRDAVIFANSHLQGAVNIPYGIKFSLWAGMVVPALTPIILIVPNENAALKIAQELKLIGLDQVVGYILPPSEQGEKLKLILPKELKDSSKYTIVDVRTPVEWEAGHIQGAFHSGLK